MKHTIKKLAIIAGGLSLAVLTTPSFADKIDQKNLCEVKGWQHDITQAACKPGQKIAYLPSKWGNEQLPVIFAAVNCDLRYEVVLTNGAVTCIYAPIKVTLNESESKAE